MPDGKAALLQGRGSQGGSAAVGQRQRRGAGALWGRGRAGLAGVRRHAQWLSAGVDVGRVPACGVPASCVRA